MENRPDLERGLSSQEFQNYYYLKEELTAFCRQEGLRVTGSKEELTKRIASYLETGDKESAQIKKTERRSQLQGAITKESLIEDHFICTEQHRAFFKEAIGKSFTFNVAFQKWLKSHPGQTYEEAMKAYKEILLEKKQSKTVIDKRFEYNTYIRDFFDDNKGSSLSQAISCWKYKKGLPGSNKYEKSDLKILQGDEDQHLGCKGKTVNDKEVKIFEFKKEK